MTHQSDGESLVLHHSLTDEDLVAWAEQAKRDDWHLRFVGSDIRLLIGEVQRLRAAATRPTPPQSESLVERVARLFDIYVRRLMVEGHIDLERADKDRVLFGEALKEALSSIGRDDVGGVTDAEPVKISQQSAGYYSLGFGQARTPVREDVVQRLVEALEMGRNWFAGYVANGGKHADEELAKIDEALASVRGEGSAAG